MPPERHALLHLPVRADFIGAWANDVTICYLCWLAQCLHQLPVNLCLYVSAVLEQDLVPLLEMCAGSPQKRRERRGAEGDGDWISCPAKMEELDPRTKLWTPSWGRWWQLGFNCVFFLVVYLVSKPYENFRQGYRMWKNFSETREGNSLISFYIYIYHSTAYPSDRACWRGWKRQDNSELPRGSLRCLQ